MRERFQDHRFSGKTAEGVEWSNGIIDEYQADEGLRKVK